MAESGAWRTLPTTRGEKPLGHTSPEREMKTTPRPSPTASGLGRGVTTKAVPAASAVGPPSPAASSSKWRWKGTWPSGSKDAPQAYPRGHGRTCWRTSRSRRGSWRCETQGATAAARTAATLPTSAPDDSGTAPTLAHVAPLGRAGAGALPCAVLTMPGPAFLAANPGTVERFNDRFARDVPPGAQADGARVR